MMTSQMTMVTTKSSDREGSTEVHGTAISHKIQAEDVGRTEALAVSYAAAIQYEHQKLFLGARDLIV